MACTLDRPPPTETQTSKRWFSSEQTRHVGRLSTMLTIKSKGQLGRGWKLRFLHEKFNLLQKKDWFYIFFRSVMMRVAAEDMEGVEKKKILVKWWSSPWWCVEHTMIWIIYIHNCTQSVLYSMNIIHTILRKSS